MSLSEGETSYICIHGANISVLLASFAITPGFTFGVWSDLWTLFLSKCQGYPAFNPGFGVWSDLWTLFLSKCQEFPTTSAWATVLLDDSLKENQSLREQLRQRDEENALKFEELSNKVDSLCKLVAEKNSGSKETKSKKGNSKVHVPTSCAKPMRHFVYLCKNIYIYDICIFQFLSYVYQPLATLLWKLQN